MAHRRKEARLLLIGPLIRSILQFQLDLGWRQLAAKVLQLSIEPSEALFTQAESLFCFLVCRDIDTRSNESQEISVVAVSRSAAIHNPPVLVLCIEQPVLNLKRLAA